MQYLFRVEGTDTAVMLEPSGSGWVARVGERTWTVDSWRPGHMLLDGNRSLSYGFAWNPSERRGQVVLGGRPVQLESPASRGQTARGGSAGGGGRVKAPMNGQVVKVNHEVGDSVVVGEMVLVLEAMKMENEVLAPIAGTIESIAVRPGQAVAAGEALFTIKPLPAEE